MSGCMEPRPGHSLYFVRLTCDGNNVGASDKIDLRFTRLLGITTTLPLKDVELRLATTVVLDHFHLPQNMVLPIFRELPDLRHYRFTVSGAKPDNTTLIDSFVTLILEVRNVQ